jgi:hypothetical protein
LPAGFGRDVGMSREEIAEAAASGEAGGEHDYWNEGRATHLLSGVVAVGYSL